MFTVKQLSDMAGVTPRTLRHYDRIGILKPSRIGDNGYRYYGEESVLSMQQILLYRELGLPLEEIGAIMGRRDFDVSAALESHKVELGKRMRRLELLTATVDRTILHLKGGKPMESKEIFAGLSPEQEEKFALEAEQMYDPQIVRESNRKWKAYSAEKKASILAEGTQVYVELLAAMPQGAAAPAVQALVQRWRTNMDHFWTPRLDQLVALAENYCADPRFKANFDAVDPQLAEFMVEAVKVYCMRAKA